MMLNSYLLELWHNLGLMLANETKKVITDVAVKKQFHHNLWYGGDLKNLTELFSYLNVIGTKTTVTLET